MAAAKRQAKEEKQPTKREQRKNPRTTVGSCMQVKKQQLELGMRQQAGSKLRNKYVKSVYSHPAYLTYMHSAPCEMPS